MPACDICLENHAHLITLFLMTNFDALLTDLLLAFSACVLTVMFTIAADWAVSLRSLFGAVVFFMGSERGWGQDVRTTDSWKTPPTNRKFNYQQ